MVAVNACVWIVKIEAVGGVTVTSIGGGGLTELGASAPPEQLPRKLKASRTGAKNILMSGFVGLVISSSAP
jgi:hypothetical protein